MERGVLRSREGVGGQTRKGKYMRSYLLYTGTRGKIGVMSRMLNVLRNMSQI